MIDCEKIKLVHELCQKHYEKTGETVVIEFSSSFGCRQYVQKLWVNSIKYEYSCLDYIIQQLKELYHPAKFKIGETVCFKDCEGKIDSMKITKITYAISTIVYIDENKGWCVNEDECFKKTQFDIGQDVWFTFNEIIINGRISEISQDD